MSGVYFGREKEAGALGGGIGIAEEYWNWLRIWERDGILTDSLLTLVVMLALVK